MKRKLYAVLALAAPLWTSLAQLAISHYEGWGEWTAVPLLIFPVLYGTVVGLLGLLLLVLAWRRRQAFGWWLGFSLIAFYPVWLLLLHRY